jgi:hypothetical protein
LDPDPDPVIFLCLLFLRYIYIIFQS